MNLCSTRLLFIFALGLISGLSVSWIALFFFASPTDNNNKNNSAPDTLQKNPSKELFTNEEQFSPYQYRNLENNDLYLWKSRFFDGSQSFLISSDTKFVWHNGLVAASLVEEDRCGGCPRASFVIRDAPALGHLARDLTLLWSILHYGLMLDIDQIVFLNPEAERVFTGKRLGRLFVDYLLPLTEIISSSAQKHAKPIRVICVDDLSDGLLFGKVVQIREIDSASPPYFGGLDGSGLRAALYAHFNITAVVPVPQRITFVDRHHTRAIKNRDEVITMLGTYAEKKMWDIDFVNLGDDKASPKTFFEQVTLFASTGVLVAMHGAACFNALSMPRNSVVVEIMPTSLRWNLFRSMSQAVGVQHLQLYVSEPVCSGGSFNDCDALVDLDVLRTTLDEALQRWYTFARFDQLFKFPGSESRGQSW